MANATIYIMAEMGNHLFQVVADNGEVIDKVDVLSAEAIEHSFKKRDFSVVWVEREAIKERKHVRNLIANYKSSTADSSFVCFTGV